MEQGTQQDGCPQNPKHDVHCPLPKRIDAIRATTRAAAPTNVRQPPQTESAWKSDAASGTIGSVFHGVQVGLTLRVCQWPQGASLRFPS
jgi:hypothetical protein